MTNDYTMIFKKTLTESEVPNIDRDPNAVSFSSDLDPEQMQQFNVEPMDPNVGMPDVNMDRDVEQVKEIVQKLSGMAKEIESLSQTVVSLERNFKGITKITDSFGDVYQQIHDLEGNLGKFIISLPATKKEEEEKQAKAAQQSGM